MLLAVAVPSLTVKCCLLPVVDGLYVDTVTLPSGRLMFAFPPLPSVTCTTAPVKSKFSPCLYIVFVGCFVSAILDIVSFTATDCVVVFPSYVNVIF